ncbi:MAG: acetyl-CoA carboxylase biotin carboxyl carrier protein [Eubacteriaceae bacterium]|nr:acetyl-CoA carboxylase biotin carboxyl carrier protein [Eubacteriaceae bacterium]
MKLQFIKDLASLMEEKALNLIEIKEENTNIRRERNTAAAAANAGITIAQQSVIEKVDVANDTKIEIKNDGQAVLSPMVGVFYAAPSPEAAAYVALESKVKKGDVLCIIEAMKLMNEITSEQDGTITQICIKNGDVVEFGQTLFYIKPGEDNE